MNKNQTDDRLSLLAISKEIEMDLSALKRYLSTPAVRDFLGSEGAPPTYPQSSLRLFQRLKQLHDEGAIKPSTLSGILGILNSDSDPTAGVRNSDSGQGSGIRNPVSAQKTLVPLAQVGIDNAQAEALVQFVAATIQRGIEDGIRNALPPPSDEALTREKAAALLGCHPSSVSRYVVPTRRGRYSAIMVQRVLAAQREAAEEKQRELDARKGARSPRRRPAAVPAPALPPAPPEAQDAT